MLKINRLRIIVNTESGKFGFDERFEKQLNFIASHKNTRGKSSCIEAIYYCLGLEELIGGKNEKALKPVFRSKLEYKGREFTVLESEFYLEVKNSSGKVITIYRPGKKNSIKPNLVRVYNGDIDHTINSFVNYEDMYVHMKGSASNEKGFHTYLEEFMGLNLPDVPSYDDKNRKLYLQIIFSTIFTEQKRGWADLFACMPTYLKIRDAKKRAIEFLIGLESLNIEKKRQLCKDNENHIKKEWENIYNNINFIADKKGCSISNINPKPEIIDDEKNYSIYKYTDNGKYLYINDYINSLEIQLEDLNSESIIIGDNINEIQDKIDIKQDELIHIEKLLVEEKKKLLDANFNIEILNENIKIIDLDLQNNKDVKKIKKLGSNKNWSICDDICPTCSQSIKDILLPQDKSLNVMTVDENIKHLEAQKSMMEFTLKNYKKNKFICESNINKINNDLKKGRNILRSIKNDLYSIDSNISESVVRKKLIIENEIDEIKDMKNEISILYDKIIELSKQWKKNLKDLANLPKSNFTYSDIKKIKDLKLYFIENLQSYGYKSISDFSEVEISEDKLMPVISGFDMKFDSSASDNIRAIWAFNVALMQTSLKYLGNHPGLLIFDEPGQQSMVISDLCKFIKILSDIKDNIQVIIGITIDDDETIRGIDSIDKSKYKLILVDDNAISPL
ncbi:hypothetical protein [Romboutsia timonensis]|jgi:molybdopterin and thiamine biosynthesis protein|uniref:hypothetical protein n=1 Tax=Romboutsia timonensis TaxID=1776391 RepID=UPI003990C26F